MTTSDVSVTQPKSPDLMQVADFTGLIQFFHQVVSSMLASHVASSQI